MKVVFIADIGIEGGATKSLVELVTIMKNQHGVETIVLTSKYNEINELLNERKIENFAVGHGAVIQGSPVAFWKKPIKFIIYAIYYYTHFHSSLNKSSKVIDWNTVDLIHTNVARDDLGIELSKRYEIPHICHIREFGKEDFNCWSYKKNFNNYLNQYTEKFIAISNAVKESWAKRGISSDKIHVIYNGVDASKIEPSNEQSKLNSKILKLVIVGGVIPSKGQYQAIEAVSLLPKEIRSLVQLDVLGNYTAAYMTEILESAKKAGIENQITFLGGCKDIYTRLKNYHVGLMCSKSEGFGRVTVEYMHAELGVIASDAGANRELIQDHITGLLYNRNDSRTLASCIQYFHENRQQLCQMAVNARKYAKKNFTQEINSNNIYDLYCRELYEVKS